MKPLYYLRRAPIFAWCLACFSLEKPHEMLRIGETEGVRHLRNVECGIVEEFFGTGYDGIGNEILCCDASFYFYQFTKISRREITFFGKVCYQRNTLRFRLLGLKISEKNLKFLYNSVINFFAGDKLTVVKPQTIVQKQFDIRDNKFAGVLVDGVAEFLTNHIQNAAENFDFRF